MKKIRFNLFFILVMLSFCQADDTPAVMVESPVQKFNQAVESWKRLQTELEALPAGHLMQAAHLAETSRRMNSILMEMHNASVDLPVSETTRVCLDYALHQGCDLFSCAAECCQKAEDENRRVSAEEIDKIVVEAEKKACECTLPIRLAVRHDLLKAGVSDRESLDQIFMIPEGTEYQGISSIDWKQIMGKRPEE